jgi:hypothetical protein
MFNEICENVARKKGVPLEQVVQAAREGFAQEGIKVGIPLARQIEIAGVRAREMAVIENLRDKGLLSPEEEVLFFGEGK